MKKKPFYLRWWFLLIAGIIISSPILHYVAEQDAKSKGFESLSEMMEASRYDVDDPVAWRTSKEELIKEYENKKAIEKAEIEARNEQVRLAEAESKRKEELEKQKQEALQRRVEAEKNRPKAVGETLQLGRFLVAVQSIEFKQKVGIPLLEEHPGHGGVFIVVHYGYISNAEKPLGVFRAPYVKLVDTNGTEYAANQGATVMYLASVNLENNRYTDINPGIQYDDATVFEVSEELLAQGEWFVSITAEGEKEKIKI